MYPLLVKEKYEEPGDVFRKFSVVKKKENELFEKFQNCHSLKKETRGLASSTELILNLTLEQVLNKIPNHLAG